MLLVLLHSLVLLFYYQNVAPWCSGYHHCTTSFNKAWTQLLRRFKTCSQCAGNLRWWESLAIVPAGNKVKRLSQPSIPQKQFIIIMKYLGLLSLAIFANFFYLPEAYHLVVFIKLWDDNVFLVSVSIAEVIQI